MFMELQPVTMEIITLQYTPAGSNKGRVTAREQTLSKETVIQIRLW